MTFFPNLPEKIAVSVKDKADLDEWDEKASGKREPSSSLEMAEREKAQPKVKSFRLR